MSKANRALTSSVKRLLNGVGVKIYTYEELLLKVNSEEVVGKEYILEDMTKNKALHCNELNLIAIDDSSLVCPEDANELVLHELIHMTAGALDRNPVTLVDWETEECTAQIGMFKLILVLGINPAVYDDRTIDYCKRFTEMDVEKVYADSDKAVHYLVKHIGMEKVA
jgi:hypothetical protein